MSSTLAIHGGRPVRKNPFPAWPIFGTPEEEALVRTLRSGKWGRSEGAEVARFEQRFAEYQGARFGIAVVNGTVALRIALLAAGIEAGDEVIVPSYTFIATATAVVEANATPIFADIEPDTYNIDPRAVERAITPRTRAVIPVHLGGLAADMEAIMSVAERHGLTVIEDACHAHGAEYRHRRLGSIGHMGCFSFQSSKNLTCGEGGIIITSDQALAEACRSIHNCGRRPGRQWYDHYVMSGNSRMSEFHGALLSAQLDRFEEQAQRRERNGRVLGERLGEIPGIRPQARTKDHTRHGYHLFVFRYDASVVGVPRSRFIEALTAEGIPAAEGYVVPLYRQPLFERKAFGPFTGYREARPDLDYGKTDCPVCERACRTEGAWLYQNLLLGTAAEVDDIVAGFQKVYDHRAELADRARQEEGSMG